MTSPIRQFPRTFLSALLGLALVATTAAAPAWAQGEDDLFGPSLDPTQPAGAEETPADPTLPEAEESAEADEAPARYRAAWINHESGVPYVADTVDIPEEVADGYHQTVQLVDEGRYAEALALLQTLPVTSYIALIELRARALAGIGRVDLAIATVDRTIADLRNNGAPFIPWPLLETRGDIYLDAEMFDQAIADYSAAVESSLDSPELLGKLGLAQVRLGMEQRSTRPDRSYESMGSGIGSLQRAVELGLDNAEIQLHLGIAKADLRDIDGAIENYLAAVAFEPESPLYHQLLASMYLRKANQISSTDPEEKAEALAEFKLALAQLDTSIELDPGDFSEADSGEESVEEDMGLDLGEGATMPEPLGDSSYIEKFEPATVYSSRAGVHNSIGDLLVDQAARNEQYHMAIADSDLALKLNDQMPDAWMHKGVALRMLGDLEQAIDAFTEVLQMAPGYSEAALRRGIAWYYLGEHDLAIMDFKDVGQYEPDPRATFWTGITEATRGNHYEAVQAYTDTLRLAPDHNLAHANRGLSYLNLGEHHRALGDFNEMIRQDQSNADAYYYRGRTYEAMNNNDGAIRSYQRALDWNPQQQEASYRLNSLDNL